MNQKMTSISILVMTAVALVGLLLSGCLENPTEQSVETSAQTTHVEQHTPGRRTISSGTGAPLSGYYVAPTSMQDLVNRYDAAFIGTISTVGDPVKEKPYDWTQERDDHFQSRGLPPFRARVTYYDITPEEVFLDDGNLKDGEVNLHGTIQLRLFGDHNSMRPRVGERFFFVLEANPDGQSYGANADWNLIHLDGGAIRNFDGKEPGYEGVTDEATLKSAAQTAADSRVQLPVAQWPVQEQWLDDGDETGEN